jgi:hypothetical protein
MKLSNYPHGFNGGVLLRNHPNSETAPGKVFFVGNNATLLEGEKIAADNDLGGKGGTFLSPFSSIDYAIGRCAAGRGDIIYIRPGHAVTVSAAAGIALDVSGVAIVGLGDGALRPTISFATSTAATLKVTGANCSLHNLIFKCNIASQATMVQIQATDVTVTDCSFREGTGSGLGFIEIGAADNDSDRFHIEKCKFYSTGANQDHFVEVLYDMVRGRILDCEGTGDCDEGCIAIPAGGNACLDLQIKGGTYRNVQTNIPAITINGTSCTGVLQDLFLITDTQSTALDNGSLATDHVTWSDETDQVSSTPVLAPADTVSNASGANNADNAFSSSSVVANADGSILEREEYIQTDMLGLPRSIASAAKTLTTGAVNMFTITGGPIKVLELVGIVTTVVQAQTTSTKVTVTTVSPAATVDFSAAAVDLTGAAAGASIRHINTTGILTVVTAGFVNEGNAFATNDTQYLVPAGTMQVNNASSSNTGAITWYMRYIPLSPLSRVA